MTEQHTQIIIDALRLSKTVIFSQNNYITLTGIEKKTLTEKNIDEVIGLLTIDEYDYNFHTESGIS